MKNANSNNNGIKYFSSKLANIVCYYKSWIDKSLWGLIPSDTDCSEGPEWVAAWQ